MMRQTIVIVLGSAMLAACGPDSELLATGTGTATGAATATTAATAATGTATGDEFLDECDPRLGDCPEGSKCWYDDTSEIDPGRNECVPITGTDAVGAECEATTPSGDSCVAGAYCVVGREASQCVGFCDSGNVCSEPGELCIVLEDGHMPLCLPECYPLDTTSCPDEWSCFEDAGVPKWYCRPSLEGTVESPGQHGAPCTPPEWGLCATGYACVNGIEVDNDRCAEAMYPGCCAQLCSLADPDASCPGANERCEPYYSDTVPAGYEDLGVCVKPG